MFAMIRAEWTKIWARGFATAALVLASVHTVVVFAGLLTMQYLHRSRAADSPDKVALDIMDAVDVGRAELWALYLPVMGVALLAVIGECVAGEYAHGTFRTLLLRPVPRWKVLLAKWIASYSYVLFLLLLMVGIGTILGVFPFGFSRGGDLAGGTPSPEAGSFGTRLGTLATGGLALAICMAPLVSLATLLGVATRSTALTVTYATILLFLDAGFSFLAPTVSKQFEVPALEVAGRWTFYFTRSFWNGYDGGLAFWKDSSLPLLGAVGYAAGFLLLAMAIFHRQDIE